MSVNLIDYFEDSSIPPIESLPQELKRHFLRVASQSMNNTQVLVEARRHPRHRIHESALAVRLTELNDPAGPPFQIFIMDISAGGIGFIHTRAFPAGRLAVRLSGMSGFSVVMIGRIVRCIFRNRAYEIGLEFVERAAKELPPPSEEFDPYVQLSSRGNREPSVQSDTYIIQNKRCT